MKMLALILGLSFCSLSYALKIPIHQGHGHRYSVLQYPDFQLVAFRGHFGTFRSQNPLSPAINSLHSEKPVIFWVVDSPGGYGDAFVQTMKQLKNGGKRHVRMIVTSDCSSACTLWAAMADETLIVPEATTFRLHRTWAFRDSFTIRTAQQMAQLYGDLGANQKWFSNHLSIFDKRHQQYGYRMTDREVLASGLADGTITKDEIETLVGLNIYRVLRFNL